MSIEQPQNSNMATGIQWGNDHTWSPAAVQMINAQSALSLSGIAWKVMQSRRQSADSLLPAARQWPRSVSAQHRCPLNGLNPGHLPGLLDEAGKAAYRGPAGC